MRIEDELYDMARETVYGENPISVILRLSNAALEGLQDYAMKGTDPRTVKQLNADDAWLLSMLTFIEINRRDAASVDEFLDYLQGRAEWLATQPASDRAGRAVGWVQAYELMIKSRQLRNPVCRRKYENGATVTRTGQ